MGGVSGNQGTPVWAKEEISFEHKETNPALRPPGSLGDAISKYYSKGNWETTGQEIAYDSWVLMKDIGRCKEKNEKFKGEKEEYEKKAKAYDESYDKGKEQYEKEAKDPVFSKVPKEKKQKLEEYPSEPKDKCDWEGPNMDLSKAWGTGAVAWADMTIKENYTYLKTKDGLNKPTDAFHNRMGYLQTSADVSGAEPKVEYVSHIMGKLGQGAPNAMIFDKSKEAQGEKPSGEEGAPQDAKTDKDGKGPKAPAPFMWGEPKTDNTPTVMVSIFPNVVTDTGLDAAGKVIQIEARASKWQAKDDTKKPDVPSAPSKPKNSSFPPGFENGTFEGGAQVLAAGIISSVAVMATLF